MEITIFVKQTEGNGFRAVCTSPIPLTAEGATREDAVRQVKEGVRKELATGDVMKEEITPKEHPMKRLAGVWKDDALFEQWKAGVEEYRRQRNTEANELG